MRKSILNCPISTSLWCLAVCSNPVFAFSSTNTDTCVANMTKFRSVRKVMERPSKHWVGDGFHVYPVFGSLAFNNELSPLLMFDYGDPKKFNAHISTKPRGVGQHPHRGFETVTGKCRKLCEDERSGFSSYLSSFFNKRMAFSEQSPCKEKLNIMIAQEIAV